MPSSLIELGVSSTVLFLFYFLNFRKNFLSLFHSTLCMEN